MNTLSRANAGTRVVVDWTHSRRAECQVAYTPRMENTKNSADGCGTARVKRTAVLLRIGLGEKTRANVRAHAAPR